MAAFPLRTQQGGKHTGVMQFLTVGHAANMWPGRGSSVCFDDQSYSLRLCPARKAVS